MNESVSMRIILLGDGAVGKTALLKTYLEKRFPTEYIPTVVDNFQTKLPIKGGGFVTVDIWDTAGQEDLRNIRKLSYTSTDVALICYSCVSITSFQNVENIWLKELTTYNSKAIFLLIGTKSDLKETFPDKQITEREAQEFCEHIEGESSIQCSAKNYALPSSNVKLAFTTAVSCHLNNLQTPSGGCCCCSLL